MRFKLFGVQIEISFLFAAVIAFLLVIDRTGLVLPTLAAAAVHETGHLLAMWAAECEPKAIRLIPASVQIVRGFSRKKHGELEIALCGPAANLVFYLSFRLWYAAGGGEGVLRFALLNLLLGLFNLLPVAGLDGGTVLQALLETRMEPYRALRTVRIIGFALGLCALAAGVVLTVCGKFNLSAYIVAVYLIITAVIKM